MLQMDDWDRYLKKDSEKCSSKKTTDPLIRTYHAQDLGESKQPSP